MNLRSYARFHLLHTSVLGGPPILTPLHYLYRGHPDQLTESLTALKICASGGLIEASKLLAGVAAGQVLTVERASSASSFVRDPSSVRLKGVSDPQRFMKKAIRSGLKQEESVNYDLRPINDPWVETEDEALAKTLLTMTPFNPRLASEIWSRSVPGAVEVTLGVFSSPTTLSQLAGVTWEVIDR
eukprot:5344753-Amphidinium_carterae.1